MITYNLNDKAFKEIEKALLENDKGCQKLGFVTQDYLNIVFNKIQENLYDHDGHAEFEISSIDSVTGAALLISLSSECVDTIIIKENNMEYVNNKMVDVKAVKDHILAELKSYSYESKKELENIIDEMVQNLVEKPAAEQANLDYIKADIYDTINNVDELRDMQRDILDEIIV